jgi:DNA-binding XRE family transcriptional regulator
MTRQIITQAGKPAFVVIPIEEWRRIEVTLEERIDIALLRSFLENSTETFPDTVAAQLLRGAHPLKVFRAYRGMTQAALAKASKTNAVYISQIERGTRRAGRKLLARLGNSLRVRPDLLRRNGDG